MNGLCSKPMDEWKNGGMEGWVGEWMHEWVGEWMDG